MYVDRCKLRTHTVKVRFSDDEMALVDALVQFTGEQKAVLLRELILARAAEVAAPTSSRHDDGSQK